MQQPSCEKASRPKIGANAPARCLTCRTRRNSTRPAPRCSAASTNAQPEQATAPPSMKRVPGPVHAVAVTPWRESRARPWTTALPTAQGYGQPLRGAAVAHRPPTSFAFGLTRRCASCPNDTHHRSFPRHRYSHRYTLPIFNGSTRFALPIPGCFRLSPALEKTGAPRLSLGMSIISGMRTASADLNQIGACGAFLSEVADLARQAELDKYGHQALAGANVLSSLAGHRRDALWVEAAAAPHKHPASRHT